MALPIPLVRLTQAERTQDYVKYGLAACLIFAAAFATFRKSAMVVPVSVILPSPTSAGGNCSSSRRWELVLVMVISVLAPGAIGMTTAQSTRGVPAWRP